MRYLILPHLRIIIIVFYTFSYHLTLFKQGNSVYTFKYKENTISVYIIYTVNIYTFEHTKPIPTQITYAYVLTLDDDRLAAGRSL